MTKDRRGRVATFYSFTGGTGRTMALANVAWILAANGHRVVVMDCNFESPGLHRYFRPFLRPEIFEQASGVADLIRGYEWAAGRASTGLGAADLERLTRVEPHAVAVDWEFPGHGCLHLLPVGRQDRTYAAVLSAMDWDDFYERHDGGRFFDALRAGLRRDYDYALIDSRHGWSEVADICTIQLPDVLVTCFPLSAQGIDGAVEAAAAVRYRDAEREIRILPVATRVDQAEQEKAEIGRLVARQRLAGLPGGMSDAERDTYWRTVEVPHRPYFAFEEILATFGERPDMTAPLLAAYQALTRYLTGGAVAGLPPMDDALRARTLARFTRRTTVTEEEVALSYAPADQVWAEWVERLLVAAGVRVHDAPDGAAGPVPLHARLLVIVSTTSAADQAGLVPRDNRGALAVYVDDARPLPAFDTAASAFVAGLDAEQASAWILRLVGRPAVATDLDRAKLGVRFPGRPPETADLPPRNTRFTGREGEIRRLRAHLRSHSGADALPGPVPLVLHGLGGVGKTEIALEYAHRFACAYDAIWWVDGDAAALDTGRFGRGPWSPGSPYPRWLVVCDDADGLERVTHRLPPGAGHLLLTSRGTAWQDLVYTLRVEVLPRRDSVRLLRRYVPMEPDQAGELAMLLGDLPSALATAGAWLASTGTPVHEYLRHVERHGLAGVEHTWSQSLDRLRDEHPTAHHLLRLCAILAPEIGLEIVYADEFAAAIAPVDPATAARPYRALLVQQINRLALLRLDVGRREIHIHRLLQHLVRSRLGGDELAEIRHRVHGVFAALRPTDEVDDPVTWPRFRLLWPHLDHCAAASGDNPLVRELVLDRVRYTALAGDFAEGHALATATDAVWRTMTGDASRRQLLRLRHLLAGLSRELGGFQAAYALDDEVLAGQRELLGPDHPETLATAGGLAADLRALGRYADALALDLGTHDACTAALGPDHRVTMAVRDGLATSRRLAGADEPVDHDAYEARQRLLGPGHPRTLAAGAVLGRDLRESGDYAGSVAVLRTVRGATEETFGPDAVPTLLASANLAVSLRCAGLANLAAPHLEEAYEQLNDRLGPTNPHTLSCRHSRAANLIALGHLDSAAMELAQVQLAYESEVGPRHPYVLACANNRAVVCRATDNLPFARSLIGEADRGTREVLGPDHPHTLAVRANLAIFHAEDGDLATAREIAADTAESSLRRLGPMHPDVLRCQANLAMMTGEWSGVLDRLDAVLGAQHPAVDAAREHRYLHRTIDPHPF
jgi:MinD-like ATPase involved in chromosome partitioning or flagellar assembly